MICSKCKLDKDVIEFNFNSHKQRYDYHCKKCHSEYLKVHYKNNKQYYKDKAKKRNVNLQNWIKEYKLSLKCKECGENHPACLDFHHLDPNEKDLEISAAINNGWNLERLLKEIEKCIVLCSNCHRKLHWNLKNNV